MQSRMERYYSSNNDDDNSNTRSKQNSDLYSKVYDVKEYDPSSNVSVISNTNEVDISKIKEILSSREEYQKVKQYKSILGDNNDNQTVKSEPKPEEPAIYDINNILEQARLSHGSKENKGERKLSSTQYDILNSLNINHDLNETEDNDKTIPNNKNDLIMQYTKELSNLLKSTEQIERSINNSTLNNQPTPQPDISHNEQMVTNESIPVKEPPVIHKPIPSIIKSDAPLPQFKVPPQGETRPPITNIKPSDLNLKGNTNINNLSSANRFKPESIKTGPQGLNNQKMKTNNPEPKGDNDNILEDLKSNDNTVVTKPAVREIKGSPTLKDENSDFFTNSLKFKKKDFDQEKLEKKVKSSNKIIKFLIFIIIVIIVVIALYFLKTYLKIDITKW